MAGDRDISEQHTICEKAPEVVFVFSEKVRSTECSVYYVFKSIK